MAIVQPIDYSSGNGFAQGLQLKGLQDEIQQRALVNEQAQRAAERQRNAYSALQSARPEDLPALRRQYPEFADVIQKEIGIQDAEHSKFVNKALNNLSVAYASGNPQVMQQAIQAAKPALASMNVPADEAWQLYQTDPKQFGSLLKTSMYATMPIEKQIDAQQNQQKIDEAIRSNKEGERLTARGQDITAQNARLSANGATSDMKNYEKYSQLLKTNPDGAALFAKVAGIKTGDSDNRQVQLSDGRTVTINGKLHGAGQNAFYEATDNAGNTIRVPPAAIAATASSAVSAQNYAMKKDLDLISDADSGALDFLTGVTGGTGKPAFGADVRSRIGSKNQRQIYNATQRIQGKMQNQGIAAARDMGASGINTVAEAKMYFQGMPQFDFSSPEAAKQSAREIREYTDNYNQQYQVDVGNRVQRQQPVAQQPAGGSFTSKSGIQFTVK